MEQKRSERISPLVDALGDSYSDEEKMRITQAVRPYFRALYNIFCRLDKEDLLTPDSLNDEADDILRIR